MGRVLFKSYLGTRKSSANSRVKILVVNFCIVDVRRTQCDSSLIFVPMHSATALYKVPPSRGIFQCLRFYRTVRRDSKSKNLSRQPLQKSRLLFPAHPHRETKWRPREVERNSYRIDGAGRFEESAERKR